MHPQMAYDLVTAKIAEDHAHAARQRQAREAREARKLAVGTETEPSLLDRITTALRNAVRPVARPTAGIA
jgi:hypothetical protein